jgi:hypothetical protein
MPAIRITGEDMKPQAPADALRVLGEPQPEASPAEHNRLHGASKPPDRDWQARMSTKFTS